MTFQLDTNISVGCCASNSVLIDTEPTSRQHRLLTVVRGKWILRIMLDFRSPR